jgi:DNA-binding NtrC family response regulator
MKGRVLVVDDERRQRDILQMILEAEGYETTAASNGRQALQAAAGEPFDVVLTDLKMPDMNGIELLSELPKQPAGPCVILMTAHGTIDSAVDAMRKGAFDYLTKPLEKDELLLVLRRAMERSHLVRENRMLHEQLRDRFRLENIVGAPRVDAGRLPRRAQGGELALHRPHLRRERDGQGADREGRPPRERPARTARSTPSTWPRCPESILEAGALRLRERARSRARRGRKIGLFEQASGSTLFLDEVGDLKRDLQVKLLRALQEREILRVGGTGAHQDRRPHRGRHQPRSREGGARGRFREDLYYRLSVIPIALPPLRERRTDIPLLVEHFIAKYAGGRKRGITDEALKILMGYDWPGNVRELESVIERALLLGGRRSASSPPTCPRPCARG